MNILIVSNTPKVYKDTKMIFPMETEIFYCKFLDITNEIINSANIIVVCFDKKMVAQANYKILIEIKGKMLKNIPILAILEEPSIQDIFTVLKLGAFDYLEVDNFKERYREKLEEMGQWNWYFGAKK